LRGGALQRDRTGLSTYARFECLSAAIAFCSTSSTAMASAGAVRPEAAGLRRNSIDHPVEANVSVLPVEETRQKGTKGFARIHGVPLFVETLLCSR
jgi:hypothetical protein